MAGGLIQIVAYGAQDLFLTGIPQITFFKIVYKKYTNFAIESIEVPLDGTPNFDNRSVTLIPKIGDLIYKIYLQVTIPQIELINNNNYVDTNRILKLNTQLSTYTLLLDKYNTFFKYNFIILNNLKLAVNSIGASWSIITTLKNKLKTDNLSKINEITINLDNVIKLYEALFPISSQSLYIGSDTNISLFVSTVNNFINDTINNYTKYEKDVYDKIFLITTALNNLNSPNDYFSWIDNLGFNLINKCSIMIGGNDITQFDSDYLNIYYSLYGNFKQRKHLNEMIGNTSDITSYSNIIKPQKILYIPLPFWFSLHNGNNLPLVSMIYHDVEFSIDFNTLDKCCFYNGTLNINNLSLSGCQLLIDYIFLDIDERTKFASFSHEYLVPNTQIINSYNLDILNGSINLDFMHPVKELFWILKETKLISKYKLTNLYYQVNLFEITAIDTYNINPYKSYVKISFTNINATNPIFNVNSYINLKYTQYYDGKYKVIESTNTFIIIECIFIDSQYINYLTTFYGIIYNEPFITYQNPIATQSILFNGINRTANVDYNYFNYTVPYQYYNATPQDGTNVYSFSLHPSEYQPSGSANFSLIKSKNLLFNLDEKYYNYITNNGLEYMITIYCTNYNILRIQNGLSSLIFS